MAAGSKPNADIRRPQRIYPRSPRLGWQLNFRRERAQRLDRYERVPTVHRERGGATFNWKCRRATLHWFALFRPSFGHAQHGSSEFVFRLEAGITFFV